METVHAELARGLGTDLLGTAYMAAIAPFRHLIVYPPMLAWGRSIGAHSSRRGYSAADAGGELEVVRRWFEALSLGPEEIRPSVSECWDADADYYPVRKFPEARPCHGLEEVSQFLARFLGAWSRLDWTIEEMLEVGDDRVLARTAMLGEGRGSGVKLEGDVYTCVWLRHGLFFRVEDHLTLSGALRALGLQGETLEAAGLRE